MSPAPTNAWTPDGDAGRPLWDALGFCAGGPPRGTITLVGAGGKTTLAHSLASTAADAGARVLIVTTTKMACEPGMISDPAAVLDALDLNDPSALRGAGRVVLAGAESAPGKFGAFPPEVLDRLRAAADLVVVEGDGSRRLPFKVPAAHEPVVPEWTDLLLVVAGLSSLGRSLGEVCCRAEVAAAFLAGPDAAGLPETSESPDARCLDPRTAAFLLRAGYLDNPRLAPWTDRRVVVLNQADDPGRRMLGQVLASFLPGERVLFTTTIAESRNQR